MKITAIHCFQVPPRWLFIKIETDEGICGWGEPVIEGRTQTIAALVKELSDVLLKRNPLNIQDIWQLLYRGGFYRGGPILMSAIAGIDQALWDIKGKYFKTPIYQLLGGPCRKKIKAYAWVGGDQPSDLIREIKQKQQKGYDTVKMNVCGKLPALANAKQIDSIIDRIAQVRDAFGHDINFGIDFHGRVSLANARILLKELEPYRPLFVEEPVLPEYADTYAVLANSTSIPLAAGERCYSRFDFKHIFHSGGLSIIQPDLSHAGGITECYKIAAMAETYQISMAPHCPLGPIALAACLQLDAVSYNTIFQEHSIGSHYNQAGMLTDYIVNKDVLTVESGYFSLPTQPGLGIEINEEVVTERSKRYKIDWHNPLWRDETDAIIEW